MGSGQSSSEATETPTHRPVTPPLPQFLLDRPVTPAPPGPDDLDQRGGWGDDFSLQGKIDDELNAPSPTNNISETELNRKNESLDKDIDKALKETDLLVNEDELTKTCQDQVNHKNELVEADLLSQNYQNQLTNLSSEGGESPRLSSNSRNTSISAEKDPEYDLIMSDKRVLVDKTTEDWVLASQEIEGFDPQKFAEANKKNTETDAVKIPSQTESSWDSDDDNIDEIMKPMASAMLLEVQSMNWYNHYQCEDAAQKYYERLAGCGAPAKAAAGNAPQTVASPLVNEIARAREQIKKSLQSTSAAAAPAASELPSDITDRISKLEVENRELKKVTEDLRSLVLRLEGRVESLEKSGSSGKVAAAPVKQEEKKEEEDDDDDDIDLFGSDDEEEDAEAERIKQERLKQYAEKKSKKPALIAKSMIIFDVKPWDDETDMKEIEDHVRGIQMDGLLWGTSKLVELAYGIKKLVITCVVEDDKVGTDDLEEEITSFESHVQSVDIAAFNKI